MVDLLEEDGKVSLKLVEDCIGYVLNNVFIEFTLEKIQDNIKFWTFKITLHIFNTT